MSEEQRLRVLVDTLVERMDSLVHGLKSLEHESLDWAYKMGKELEYRSGFFEGESLGIHKARRYVMGVFEGWEQQDTDDSSD